MTAVPTIESSIGAPWAHDPATYTWTVNGPDGPVTMSFQWRENGAVLALPSGEIAIRDARSFS